MKKKVFIIVITLLLPADQLLHPVSSISQLRIKLVHVSGIIIITDGVTSVPDVAVCETLLNQLRSGTIACSFVQVNNILQYSFFPKTYVQNVHGTVPLMVSCVYAALYASVVLIGLETSGVKKM